MCKLEKMEDCNKKKNKGVISELESYLTTLVNFDYTLSEVGME
jgi:hypothetical protein